ncbi:MAG TPA: hypothetical protein VIC26_13945 [Marinagarivorans sp.]
MRKLTKCFILLSIFMLAGQGHCDIAENSTQELQVMLDDIKYELEERGEVLKKKQERIRDAESRFSKMINKNSWRNAVIGSVLTAAVTAHPAGLLVGGIAGGMVGKSKKYEEAEEQLAIIEHEIIVDEDDFLTEGEVRLANFAGDEVDPHKLQVDDSSDKKLALAPSQTGAFDDLSDEPPEGAELDTIDFERTSTSPNTTQQTKEMPMLNVAEALPALPLPARASRTNGIANQNANGRVELESCYGRDAEAAAKKRQRLPHCFYMMY